MTAYTLSVGSYCKYFEGGKERTCQVMEVQHETVTLRYLWRYFHGVPKSFCIVDGTDTRAERLWGNPKAEKETLSSRIRKILASQVEAIRPKDVALKLGDFGIAPTPQDVQRISGLMNTLRRNGYVYHNGDGYVITDAGKNAIN